MRSGRRVLVIVCGVAVVSLVVGLVVGSRLTSPADAAAKTEPPKASRITVPVEHRSLQSTIITRGDASYQGSAELEIQPDGPGIVTGKVPEAGSRLTEGDVLLEVTGRPVIALGGVLPAYRTLEPGAHGPDVEQLEQALQRLGLDPGDVDEDYTTQTSAAVERLYRKAEYAPPKPSDQARQAVQAAEQEVDAAEEALDQAESGPSETEKAQAENAVREAERALEAAKKSGAPEAIAQAEDNLRLARAELDDLLDGEDTTAEQEALDEAREELADAEAEYGAPLPASEVVYVEKLPRRINEVDVSRGSKVGGKVATVSGTDLTVVAPVDTRTKQQLKQGMRAILDLGSGIQVDAEVTSIDQAGTDEWDVTLKPEKLTSDQFELLRESNVRVSIPVGSTRGKVLAVPVAALSAGSGGESRVEVMREGKRHIVEVEVGLSTDGYAEVTPVDGDLRPGDRVVVGR